MFRLGLFAATLALPGLAHAGTLVTFDNLPKGPSYFAQAGPAQTITYPGVATFSGGVILGLASAFPANIYASNPNQYGTADFGDNLSSTLKVAVSPSFAVHEISFALFNGESSPVSYVVDAFDGSKEVATQTFNMVPSNLGLGYVLPDLKSAAITSLTIAPTMTVNGWDFLIDDVAFNESVQQAVTTTPEPSSLVLMGSGLLGLAAGAKRRLRRG